MYTLEELRDKTFRELKALGYQLNALLDGDKRCRQNWIDAIAGVQFPLLALLEESAPADSDSSGAIEVQTSPGAIELQRQESLLESPSEALQCPSCGAVHSLYTKKDYFDRPLIRCLYCDYGRFKNYPGAIRIPVRETIAQVAKIFPGVGLNFDRAASTALRASVFEFVPEPPDPEDYRSILFYRVLGAYYDRYPGSRYRDGEFKINTKIFLGLPIRTQRTEPIAQLPNISPGVEDIQGQNHAEPNGIGTEQTGTDEIAIGLGIHQQCYNPAQPDGISSGFETETPRSQKGDRILATAGNGQAVKRRPLPRESNELTALFSDDRPPNRGDNGRDRLESEPVLSQSAIEPVVGSSQECRSLEIFNSPSAFGSV